MNQAANPNNPQLAIDQRLRTMRTVWIALLLSIAMYYVFTIFAGRPDNLSPNPTLFLGLLAVGLSTTLLSFLIKSKLLAKATDQQQPQGVQQAYVVAWAMCEVSALLGVIDFFLTANSYYYSLFVLGALGELLHFPRREHVINASFKSSAL